VEREPEARPKTTMGRNGKRKGRVERRSDWRVGRDSNGMDKGGMKRRKSEESETWRGLEFRRKAIGGDSIRLKESEEGWLYDERGGSEDKGSKVFEDGKGEWEEEAW
jgi:hypothetical protein